MRQDRLSRDLSHNSKRAQVEYDLGSENIIKDLGSVSKGKLAVGQASYSRVVIPPMTENLDLPTFGLLEKFVSDGGTLISFFKTLTY